MKHKLFSILISAIFIFSGCAENDFIDTTHMPSGKTFTVKATMPAEEPATRVALSPGYGNYPSINLIWEANDDVELCLIQGDKKFKQSVTIKNISPDGKNAEFDVNIPQEFIATEPFDIYGIYGGGGLDDSDPTKAKLSPPDILNNPPTGLTGENSLQASKIVALSFAQKGIPASNPEVNATFRHLGSMLCIRLKNTGAGDLNTEGKKFILSSYSSSQWQVWGNYTFDITSELHFDKGETDTEFAGNQTIASGQTGELWTWIVPTGKETGSLDFWMYDSADASYKRSDNFLPGRNNLQTGKTYYINAEWDGNKFTFSGGIPKPNIHTITFEEDYFKPFIDYTLENGKATQHIIIPGWAGSPRPHPYPWIEPTTKLMTLRPQLGWGEGYPWILSPYNSKNNTAFGDYLHDLYVYHPTHADASTGGGNNGSNRFIVNYGYSEAAHPEYGDGRPIFGFDDNIARTVISCYVNSTCYFLNVAANGNSLSPALGEGEDVILHAMGYDSGDRETGTVTMTFATKDHMITKWTKWDLSALGKIVKLRINMTGGTDNGYGFSLPAYYAIDDITVNME